MMFKFHGLVKTQGAVAVACSDSLGSDPFNLALGKLRIFLVQAVVIGCCVAVFVLARYSNGLSLTLTMFAFLALIGFSVYFWALQKSERLAVDRREALVGELCRAQ